MKVRCPICQSMAEWKENPSRPFCSEPCKSKDLGKWATEAYRVPSDEPAEAEIDPTPARPTSEE